MAEASRDAPTDGIGRGTAAAEIMINMFRPLNAPDEHGLLYYWPFDDAGMEGGSKGGSSLATPPAEPASAGDPQPATTPTTHGCQPGAVTGAGRTWTASTVGVGAPGCVWVCRRTSMASTRIKTKSRVVQHHPGIVKKELGQK